MRMMKEDVKQYISDNEEIALEKASQILGKVTSMQSFNGIIGGKNATYEVNVLDYSTPEKYVRAWMKSHEEKYEDEKHLSFDRSSHRVHELLKDDFLKEYIKNYLARTYFNKRDKAN